MAANHEKPRSSWVATVVKMGPLDGLDCGMNAPDTSDNTTGWRTYGQTKERTGGREAG